MPRTKAARKIATEKPSKIAIQLLPMVENERKAFANRTEGIIDNYMLHLSTELKKSKISIPKLILGKTIRELKELPLNWSGNSINSTTMHTLETTKLLTEKKRKPVGRRSSFGDDEGYLTAESSKNTSGGRQSRTRSRSKNTLRVSRSLSSRPPTTSKKYKTPANKIPLASYGTVTPKVKPNTPQVLLRRPKLGEMALSLQGSPLMTGSVVADKVANVNIPLDNGDMLSIQPQRGLRMSQIPELDLDTRRQLETLRDNLNKMCALSGMR